jgi:hypothetical protein
VDEVFLTTKGERRYLWRAVDQDDNVLDLLVQRQRNTKAAKKFLRTLLKGLTYVPWVLITDQLKSDGAAKREILPGVEHRQSRDLNNRCEHSHRPTRQRERRMQGFKSPVMPSAFCRRMAPSPNTSARDGICCQRPRTVKRCATDSSVGPRSQVRSGLPKRQGGPGSHIRVPDDDISLNKLTEPSNALHRRMTSIAL